MSFLVAFAAGAGVAALALALEAWSLGHSSFSQPALAAYALLGGALAAAARAVFSLLFPVEGNRLNAVAVVLAIAWANTLYVVNVVFLAGEPYSSWKSLACDLLVTLPYALLIPWIARSRWLAERRERHTRPLAAAGTLILLWSIFTLVTFANGHARRALTTPDPAAPDILLVILDSARRDHLGYHGYARPTSPALDAWTARARVYESAFSASSWTVPTVASLLSVRQPQRPEASLVDLLGGRGYATGCFTDNPHLTPGSPLTAHFGVIERSVGRWRDPLRRTLLGEIVERIDGGNDRALVDRALAWAERAPGPRFLYIHLMDSHTPYRFPPIDGKPRRGRRIEFPVNGMSMTPEEKDGVVARYDAGVRSASEQAARLLAGIASRKRPFLAIVTADHGESLGDEGSRWFHGTGLFPELLAVPLLAVGDGVAPGRVTATVGHASITRTVLAAAGIACPGCDGSDLRTGEGDAFVRGEQPPNLAYMVGLGHKLVVDTKGSSRLYSLQEDPAERADVAAQRPEVARRLLEKHASSAGRSLDAEAIERLRSLGYASPGK